MIQEISSLLEETTYAYDGNDNPVSMADGEQRETAVTYDLNRWPVSVAYSGGRQRRAWQPDGEEPERRTEGGVPVQCPEPACLHDGGRRGPQLRV